MHEVCLLRALAFESAGSNNAARIAMIAITTSSSISVNALLALPEADFGARSLARIAIFTLLSGAAARKFFHLGAPASLPASCSALPRRQGCRLLQAVKTLASQLTIAYT